ncbi:hypothetical protein Bcav_2430 [Beutenbergia cavernae DSM 12333]|uniref:DUF5302 domain-containing protein n=1 Tax=Beutenbergia cavernae (strain ATCC BAA-8 / DSM 12333 / CCUG 43141 / JCM 11478 / NBRC 16432 / NCIMB 13614 / HKI 0122) TaxID=471853 RepID=C5BWL4_BEUC1|nr:DUF5302 domain-containing protein [Beutenbergia cavernae]ACQ80680.1 hypothetical protein Bcav_2430 [Beutenbergia cavernae DSM 12333]
MSENAHSDDKADPTSEAKEKFREALERKNAASHKTEQARRNTGSVHGSEVNGPGGRRMFRRKSG